MPMQELGTRAFELLHLGRLPEALETFSKANDIFRPAGGTYLEYMGTVLWLMGHRGAAKELYRSAVDGIRFGTIGYADSAGGVEQGLLLWYAGITTKDRNATEHALDYLSYLVAKKEEKEARIAAEWPWPMPGPLVQFVLGRQSFKDLLKGEFKTDDVQELIQRARTDLFLAGQLVQALFVLGTMHRNKRDEQGCRRAFEQCARLETSEVERHLAAAEVGLYPFS